MEDIQILAEKLRQAAFPGALGWSSADQSVRDRWIEAAKCAESLVLRTMDKVLREASAKAHEIGQYDAAQMLRELRQEFSE